VRYRVKSEERRVKSVADACGSKLVSCSVIPAKAGIQQFNIHAPVIPAKAGIQQFTIHGVDSALMSEERRKKKAERSLPRPALARSL